MLNHLKMQLARTLSFKSKYRVKIGSVVVKGKSIVGVGYNKIHKTHPLITNRNHLKKLHAEVDTIIGVNRKLLEGATMYSYRELHDGSIGMCKPCCDCQAILKEAGIKRIYYTDPSEKEGVGILEFKNL